MEQVNESSDNDDHYPMDSHLLYDYVISIYRYLYNRKRNGFISSWFFDWTEIEYFSLSIDFLFLLTPVIFHFLLFHFLLWPPYCTLVRSSKSKKNSKLYLWKSKWGFFLLQSQYGESYELLDLSMSDWNKKRPS